MVALAAAGLMASSVCAQAPGAERRGAVAHFSEAHRLLSEGHPRAAEREFMAALEAAEGTPLAAYAQLGLAWTALARGALAESELLLEDALPTAGAASPGAEVLLGLLRGRDGRTADAVTELDRAYDKLRDPNLRDAALLAKGYVLYWSGAFDRAAAAFDGVAVPGSGAPLVDDARYGAAWSRWKAGDRNAAEAALAELAAVPSTRPESASPPRALIDLHPDAVFADAVRRYRRSGVQRPETAIVTLLDADGSARARKALKRIASARADVPAGSAEPATPEPFERLERGGEVPAAAASPAAPDVPRGSEDAGRRGRAWLVGVAILLVALATAVALVALRRRRRPR